MNQLCPIEILSDLVSFETISKKPNEEIVDYLEKFFAPLGFNIFRIKSPDEPTRYNLLCSIGPDKEDGLMLSGHMDVVPVAGQNWHSDPFCLVEKEERLIGRGAADMKGFIAATCSALGRMSLAKLKKPLSILWTYDEEIGCLGSHQAAPLLKNYLKHLPKAALVGEPTDFAIYRMHSGHVTVKISMKGKGVHSSDPDLGISAIKALNKALDELFKLEKELRQEESLKEFFKRPFVLMNVGEIHGGSAVNIVPDEAYAMIGFRPLPKTSIDEVFKRIVEACNKDQDKRVKINVTIEKISPAMFTHTGTDLEQILIPFANKSNQCAAQFSTDGGNLSQNGIECLIFGPGSIDVAHQANEWVSKNDLLQASDKIEKIITAWCLK